MASFRNTRAGETPFRVLGRSFGEALCRTRTDDPLLTIEQRDGKRGQARVTQTKELRKTGESAEDE
jgi:hypothetical protein